MTESTEAGQSPASPRGKMKNGKFPGGKKSLSHYLKAIWHFIWEDDSLLSWIVNAVLAFILIKFIVYPGIGFVFGTTHPIVAVMSASMEHNGDFEDWWQNDQAFCGKLVCNQQAFYYRYNISKSDFQDYRFPNGFNTGDIMVVVGSKPEKINRGDTIVYWSREPIPIIHRVIIVSYEEGHYYFTTKGDNNPGLNSNEVKIPSSLVVGKAVARVPYLGWVKIGFVRGVNFAQNAIVGIFR